MGGGSWNPSSYSAYSSTIAHTTDPKAVFKKEELAKHLDPLGVLVRESRDSADNPKSTPLIVAIDQTGSMGMLAHTIAKQGLGVLFTEVLDRRPISDPHVMFIAIGDSTTGEPAPLQVSQFEADNRIVDQLQDIYLVGRGGGNSGESYHLAWYFAAMHTSHDSWEKRQKKGYLFTVGDEPPLDPLTSSAVKKFIGDTPERDLTNQELLTMAQRTYHVFHVVVEEGNYCQTYGSDYVVGKWRPLLGQNVLPLSDHTKLSEVIVSAMQVVEGIDRDKVVASWTGGTSLVVGKAIGALTPADGKVGGVVRF